jgi:hypothetical protein
MKINATLKKGKKNKLKIKGSLTGRELAALSSSRELRLLSGGIRIFDALIRVLLSMAVIVSTTLLFSCTSIYGYGEPEDKLTVSALGFDGEGESISVIARSAVDERIFIGEGESVDGAMAHIKGADEKGLELSHLALVVVGDGIRDAEMKEILDFCLRNGDVSVGVSFAATHSARELLSSASGDGFRLASALREGKDGGGYTKGCRFYEIGNAILDRGEGYQIPYFSKWEGGYTLDGLKIYAPNGSSVRLDRSESAYYMMIKGRFDGGAVDFEYGGREYSVFVSECRTVRREADEKTMIECRLALNELRTPVDDVERMLSECSNRATELCQRLFERYGDVFGMGFSGDMIVRMVSE